jgi:hypothetical protein
MQSAPVFAGVDVSKARLDVASTAALEAWSVSNTSDGIAQLVERLREIGPAAAALRLQ